MKFPFIKPKKWSGVVFFITGALTIFLIRAGMEASSSDAFCASCHVHPHATSNWLLGPHSDNKSGVKVHCTECHLPPDGLPHLAAKISTGGRDLWAMLVSDTEKIDWQSKTSRDAAARHVYKSACIKCHQNLFPRELSKKGEDAHLYYERFANELRCINCHIDAGHYRKERETLPEEPVMVKNAVIYSSAARIDSFDNFIETIPGTPVAFEMIAIPGGTFPMGSPGNEPFRREDEGPVREISVDRFWLGKFEVSWQEFDTYYKATHRSKDIVSASAHQLPAGDVDGITGPTAPYGNPDQGWGRGTRPAITMTHFAAQEYCRWLSEKTGKLYRLPTEAEWEYACRAGTEGPYFFAGSPGDYSAQGLINSLFGPDTAVINSHAIYKLNSMGRTSDQTGIKPNPFGLVHMLGNVREFCADPYSADRYGQTGDMKEISDAADAQGDVEYVIRGGSFKSDAGDLRIARRDRTNFNAWMKTDPQIPKSKWWYSDCNDVGFRVVCESADKK